MARERAEEAAGSGSGLEDRVVPARLLEVVAELEPRRAGADDEVLGVGHRASKALRSSTAVISSSPRRRVSIPKRPTARAASATGTAPRSAAPRRLGGAMPTTTTPTPSSPPARAAHAREPGAARTDPRRVDLRPVGREHRQHRAGAHQQQHDQRLQGVRVAPDLVAERGERRQRRGGEGGERDHRPPAAPEPVQQGDHERRGQADQGGVRQQAVGRGRVQPAGAQVGGQPEQESVVHQPPADPEQRHADREPAERPAEQLGVAALGLSVFGLVRAGGHQAGPEALHDRPRLRDPAHGEQEARRLGDPAVQRDQQHAGRQPEQPHHAPPELRFQPRCEPARDDVGARDVASDQHHQPAAMADRHRLREQGERDRQHPAHRHAHQEAHHEVQLEHRHRAADRGRDEHQAREQDRRAAADPVPEPSPRERADDHAHQRAPAGRSRRARRHPGSAPTSGRTPPPCRAPRTRASSASSRRSSPPPPSRGAAGRARAAAAPRRASGRAGSRRRRRAAGRSGRARARRRRGPVRPRSTPFPRASRGRRASRRAGSACRARRGTSAGAARRPRSPRPSRARRRGDRGT